MSLRAKVSAPLVFAEGKEYNKRRFGKRFLKWIFEMETQGRGPKKSRNLIAVLCCFADSWALAFVRFRVGEGGFVAVVGCGGIGWAKIRWHCPSNMSARIRLCRFRHWRHGVAGGCRCNHGESGLGNFEALFSV